MISMKSEWKNYNGLLYRRIKENDHAVYIEYNGAVGGYAKGEYISDEEFIKSCIETMKKLSSESTKEKQISEQDKILFDRWQSETGFEE